MTNEMTFEGFENGRVINVNKVMTDSLRTASVEYTLTADGVIMNLDKGTPQQTKLNFTAKTTVRRPDHLTHVFDVDDSINGKFTLKLRFCKTSVVMSVFDFGGGMIETNLAFDHNEMSLADAEKFVNSAKEQLAV